MTNSPAQKKPAVRKPGPSTRVRRMSVRQLRERYAGITPCPLTQNHVLVERQGRAHQMLQNMVPVLAEQADGSLEPRGYPASTAALLQVLDADMEVETLIRPAAICPAASPLPLILELNYRIVEGHLQTLTESLFAYWEARGVERRQPFETIASELAQSTTTYMRKLGWAYPREDAANEPEFSAEPPAAEPLPVVEPLPVAESIPAAAEDFPADLFGFNDD